MRAVQSGLIGAPIFAALAIFLAGDSDAAWPGSGRAGAGSVAASFIAASINFTSGTASGTGCASLSSCIADTRSTTATYVNTSGGISSAAINTPRIDCTGSTCGLLNEGASTNLVPYSVASTANWSYYNSGGGLAVTYTSGVGTAPDGTTSLTSVSFGATSSSQNSQFYIGVTYPTSTTYTHSAWIMADPGNINNLTNPLAFGMHDTSGHAGTIVTPSSLTRFSFTSAISAISGTTQIGYVGGYGTSPYLSPLVIDIWGDQVEALGFASSYIPTNGATVTRAADGMSASGALATALAAGQSYVDMIDMATNATSRTLYAAGAFNWPAWKRVTQICAYTPSVPGGYLTSHSTYGTAC